GVAYQGIRATGLINQHLNTLYDRDLKGLSSIKEANINLIYIGRALRAAILANEKSEVEQHRVKIEKYVSDLNANLTAAEKTIVTDEGKRTCEQVKTWLAEYYPQVTEVMRLVQAGDDKAAG